ncbi:MAG: choline ABC transporter ATP-binding protein [Alphaproteobacteria bacterium]
MAVVTFDRVDVVFGPDSAKALALLDRGENKDEIYAGTDIVVGVAAASLAVDEGEIFVLMGLSGSGKSTLLRCVNGLNKVTRGRVLVRDDGTDIDIAACDAATLRQLRMNRISMVFQQFALMPWRTVRDNVAYGLEVRGMSKAERYRKVEEVLELVRLDQWIDKYPHELSGGMQQRVGLARAFATDAEILLMDEPFSALDPLIREHLQDELLEFQRRLQKTILFVSHDLDEALKIGTRIAIMESGRIVQTGRPEEIITRPATGYVRQFVANVNPLNVLRAATLMRPAESLAHETGGAVRLDDAGACRLQIDGEGRPVACRLDGGEGRLVACGDAPAAGAPAAGAPGERVLVVGGLDTPMRVAIEICHRFGRPMPILDAEGRLAGVIGVAELMAGMLRRQQAMPEVGGADDAGEEPDGGPAARDAAIT